MSRKKPSYSQSKEAAIQKCQNSCSEKIWKIRKGVVLIFAIKKTPPHVIPGNSLEYFKTRPDGCFWGNSRGGFLFHRCSRPEVLEQLFRKIRESSQEKICVGVLFLILPTKTLYYGQFPGIFKYFRTTTSRNSFGRLLLEGSFSTEAVDRKCQKSYSEKFEKFLKKTSVGIFIFSFLANKTTLPLIVS